MFTDTDTDTDTSATDADTHTHTVTDLSTRTTLGHFNESIVLSPVQ